MFIFNEETRVYKIITLLCVVGEYPIMSLGILGSRRHYRRLVTEMTKMQEYRNSETGERISCKALTISGKGKMRTLRLTKNAIRLLEWVGGAEYYCQTFLNNTFSGAKINVDRNHRVAEVVAMMQSAGIEYRPWELPYLQDKIKLCATIEEPSYYLSKHLKQEVNETSDKYSSSRVVGAMMTPHETFVVYNTRDNVMRWGGIGECKMHYQIEHYAAYNVQKGKATRSIVLGRDLKFAIEILNQTDSYIMKNGSYIRRRFKYSTGMAILFEAVHFVPLSDFGSKLLEILTVPNFHRKLLDLVYEEDELSDKCASFVYDAYRNERYILSFLDADIIRLRMFKRGIEYNKREGRELHYAVLCFPEQEDELREYLGDEINYQTLEIDDVLERLFADY